MTASYGLLTYLARPEYNAGDYIQSLAARQFLPKVDKYVNREKLHEYNGGALKVILNGWFMHRPANWPPSESITPLVTSFHINSQAHEQMLNKPGVAWFRKHGPIGCRDQYTMNALSSRGIDTYLSGCLTSTFENNFDYRTDDIYFCDVLFRVPGWSTSARTPREFLKAILYGDVRRLSQRSRLMRAIFSGDLLARAKNVSHYHPVRHAEKQRFEVAASFLEKYATAKLVVTSRLHCAIPCLAFGTPVIFVHCGFKHEYDTCRLNGVMDLFNTIFIDEHENITANFNLNGKIDESYSMRNPELFRDFVPALRQTCVDFVNGVHQAV